MRGLMATHEEILVEKARAAAKDVFLTRQYRTAFQAPAFQSVRSAVLELRRWSRHFPIGLKAATSRRLGFGGDVNCEWDPRRQAVKPSSQSDNRPENLVCALAAPRHEALCSLHLDGSLHADSFAHGDRSRPWNPFRKPRKQATLLRSSDDSHASIESLRPLRIFLLGLAILAVLPAPALWGYRSSTPAVLGRFSPGYAALLAMHAGFIVACLALAGPLCGLATTVSNAVRRSARRVLRSGWALGAALAIVWELPADLHESQRRWRYIRPCGSTPPDGRSICEAVQNIQMEGP